MENSKRFDLAHGKASGGRSWSHQWLAGVAVLVLALTTACGPSTLRGSPHATDPSGTPAGDDASSGDSGSRDFTAGTSSPDALAGHAGEDAGLPEDYAQHRHPTVYLTPKDIARAHKNIALYPWAESTADEIVRRAERYTKQFTDELIKKSIPGEGAVYADGINTMCPICGERFAPNGRGGGLNLNASFSQPGRVTCNKGHTLPDSGHPDPGSGYAGPNGQKYYLVGLYYSWALENLRFGANELAQGYSLTGDERYAAKVALFLDEVAAIYPTSTKGPLDYPREELSGRLNRANYSAARMLVQFVDQYDRIYHSPSLDKPSAKQGLTRRQNIEQNLFKNGAAYCYDQSRGWLGKELHNGQADYIRGFLTVGVCLDMPQYVEEAVVGPRGIYAFLSNNIDRDGQYVETSASYADHTRDLYVSFAEPLLNTRGQAYPGGLDLYQHPNLRQFLTLHNLALQCVGHRPRYGDSSPDTSKISAPSQPLYEQEDYKNLEILYARAHDSGEANQLAALLRWMGRGDVDAMRDDAPYLTQRWMLFHSPPVPASGPTLDPARIERVTRSHLIGQKGLGILRAGTGKQQQALLLRFGPTLNHGHWDDLNLNYFARGYELTYDLGYGSGATHTAHGWAKQTASHNLVVVNEQPQGGTGETGGSLHLFSDLPTVKLVEASSEASYATEGVTLYRRTAALINGVSGDGASASDAYLVDIFRVAGGTQHDYMFHARSTEVDFAGVAVGPKQTGSLAGANYSWGNMVGSTGYLSKNPGAKIAPPGNGYGFLMGPQRGRPSGAWSADWTVDSTTRLRLNMPAQAGLEVITADAPGITSSARRARYVVARRKGTALQKQFAAVIEPHGGTPSVLEVERLTLSGAANREVPAVALKVTHRDGTIDLVYSSGDATERGSSGLVLAGRFIHARVKGGDLTALSMVGAKRFKGYGWEAKPASDAWSGTVAQVDYQRHTVTTTASLPLDRDLDGATILFSRGDYSRNTAYRVAQVSAAGSTTTIQLRGTLTLGQGQIESMDMAKSTLTSLIPHGWGRAVFHRTSGFFVGKLIQGDSGASTTITDMVAVKPDKLEVQSLQGFEAGDTFYYRDVQPGDRLFVPQEVSLVRTGGTTYRASGNTSATVTAPAGVTVQ